MADGFFGRLAPVLQGVGGSLLAGGNLDQAGALIAQAQQAQGQQQLRNLRAQQVEASLAEQQRKQQQDEALRAALGQGGLFGGQVTPEQQALLAADPSLARGIVQAQLEQKLAPSVETPAQRATRQFNEARTLQILNELGVSPTGQPQPTPVADTGIAGELPALTARQRARLAKTLTPGEKAIDTKFAPDVAAFDAGGGFATVQGHLRDLTGVANRLDPRDKAGRPTGTPENLTGPLQGLIAGTAFENLTPQSKEARQLVENAVVSNLRQILGAQFTAKEGERILQLTFDPGLKERQIGRRVRNLVTQMRTAARQKAAAVRHFKRRGTLRGFKGEMPNFNFDPTRRTAPRAVPQRRQPAGEVAAAEAAAPSPSPQTPPAAQGRFNTLSDAAANVAEGQMVRQHSTGQWFQKQGDRLVAVQNPNLGSEFQFQGQPGMANPVGDPSAQFRFLPPVPLTNIGR